MLKKESNERVDLEGVDELLKDYNVFFNKVD